MEQSNSSARRIQHLPRRKFIGVALAALGAASAGAGFAQDYPSRPIRIVVPFSPGGGVDALVRAYAVKLAASLGQPVIVDNRPGANGMIAADNVARSAADGYSLLASGSWLQTGSFLYRSFAFSPERDFTPVALIAETPMQIIVRSEVPAKSMSELIAYAKVNPGKLSYGTPGAGHPFHLAVEMLSQVTHAKFVHVPFKGGGPAIQEFLAGRIDMLFFPVNPTLADMIKSGKARVLASATDERLRSLPDVPTFREAGITVAFDDVRRAIGMGGDKLLPAVAGLDENTEPGAGISKRRGDIFKERYLPTIAPLPKVRELAKRLRRDGFTLTVASSAKEDELRPLLERAQVHDLIADSTSSDDADRSKPDPDIVQAALRAVDGDASRSLMLGDTPYDIEAARRAGVAIVALQSGGWQPAELSGALEVYRDPEDLLNRYESSAFARMHGRK